MVEVCFKEKCLKYGVVWGNVGLIYVKVVWYVLAGVGCSTFKKIEINQK